MMKIYNLIFLGLFFSVNILLSQQNLNKTININGQIRSYRIYIPASYNENNVCPLVLNFHGYTSTNVAQESYGDFRTIADTANFILVHPQGLDIGGGFGWNSFSTTTETNYDYQFINILIDTLLNQYAINPENIFSTGMSNGGFFSYDLACFMSHRINAIASVTGSMIQSHLNACNPSKVVPILQIHGTNDATVSYNGTGGIITSVAIDDLIDFWKLKNNCTFESNVTNLPNTSISDLSSVEKFEFFNIENKADVIFYKVLNGGHTWPGSSFPIVGVVTNQDMHASTEIWKFFYRNLKTNSSLNTINLKKSLKAFHPNPVDNVINVPNNIQNQIKIKDLNGKVLGVFDAFQSKIDVSFLNKGIYFINIEGENHKFIKN